MEIMKNKLPLLISILSLIAIIAVTSIQNKPQIKTSSKKAINTSSIKIETELRGVWISFLELDMAGTDRSYQSFKERFKRIADNSKEKKFNTLIVQVRPYSDALYNSSYYPFSHIISGIQGKDPEYDPLKYMCAYAHKIGLKIHAWVNPYRIRSSKELKLSDDNPYMNNRDLGVKVGNGIYYNPALPKVRRLIENGVKEIVDNYDVDGIQFDDYFYPTKSENFDKIQYEKYKRNVGSDKALSLKEWRKANVNILVADCYTIVHNSKENVVFGISPQGNIDNDYEMYADIYSWCTKSGYIDYICPQLYYSLDNPALSFERALKSWTDIEYNPDVNLYIGLAGYKAGTDADSGTWEKSDNILQKEVKMVRENKINGFMFFSYNNLETVKAKSEVKNLVKVLN